MEQNSINNKVHWITSWKVLVPAIIVAVMAMMAATFVAKSNADYICTRIIEDESACNIDEWSEWRDVDDGDPEAGAEPGTTYEVRQVRIGTGTKTLSRVIEYLNRRTSCSTGFTQRRRGNSGGASGYMGGGRTFTTSAVCQIEESRTVTRTVPDPNDPECAYVGAPGCPADIVSSPVTATETLGEVVTGGEQELDGMAAINEFRRQMIDADIVAIPALVAHDGATTEIRWKSRETTRCTVSGDNGDLWEPIAEVRDESGQIITQADNRTSGVETSSEINGRTVYTLSCTAFDGSTVTDTVVIDRVPITQEI